MSPAPVRSAISATVFSVFAMACIETLWPLELVAARPSLLVGLFANVVGFGFKSLRWSIAYLAAVILAEAALRLWARERRAVRAVVHGALAVAVSAYAYMTLLRYEVFKETPVLVVPYVVAAAFLGALGAAITSGRARKAGAVVILPDSYFTFHLSLFQLTLPVLGLGLTYALSIRESATKRGVQVATLVALGLVLATPLARAQAKATRPEALLHTLIGRLQVVYAPFTEGSEGPPIPRQIDPEGVDRFRRQSGLPELPEAFRLDDYNILLVTSEAVRFDKTSLANESLGTTPNLLALARSGAFSFTRAHSPSSATLPSNAAFMAMTFPAAVRLDAWSRSWCGEIGEDETTAAELLSQAGYSTFRVSHDFHYGFSVNLLGFDQGFAQNDLFPEATEAEGLTLDMRIAEKAAERIREHKAERFFGWVYFAAPHEPYYTRYDDMPKATLTDRYVQELRYMDEAFGVLEKTLRDEGLLEKTIVVFVADHGEELEEHGGKGHKTLHGECTNVPMVVRIPGVSGGDKVAVTSTLYVLPWLLQRGSEPLRAAAERRMREDIGPMMRATDGAVVVELVSYDKMSTALVYSDKKIIYNFIADAAVAFDLTADPTEQRDLMLSDPASAQGLLDAVQAYRQVRRGMRRYTLDPTKRPDHSKVKRAKREAKQAEEPADEP